MDTSRGQSWSVGFIVTKTFGVQRLMSALICDMLQQIDVIVDVSPQQNQSKFLVPSRLVSVVASDVLALTSVCLGIGVGVESVTHAHKGRLHHCSPICLRSFATRCDYAQAKVPVSPRILCRARVPTGASQLGPAATPRKQPLSVLEMRGREGHEAHAVITMNQSNSVLNVQVWGTEVDVSVLAPLVLENIDRVLSDPSWGSLRGRDLRESIVLCSRCILKGVRLDDVREVSVAGQPASLDLEMDPSPKSQGDSKHGPVFCADCGHVPLSMLRIPVFEREPFDDGEDDITLLERKGQPLNVRGWTHANCTGLAAQSSQGFPIVPAPELVPAGLLARCDRVYSELLMLVVADEWSPFADACALAIWLGPFVKP